MHFLRLLLATWLEIGIVTVFFLFWLCKRTVSRINTLDKPVLDQDTFQQLLAAAYTLQEQNRLPVNETKADSSQAVSLRPKSLPMTQSEVEPLASLNASAVPSSRDKRIPRSDEFFWRVATAVAMAALFALLLVTSHDRLSALPARLEVVQQEVPLRRVPPLSDGVATKTIIMEPEATKTGPNERKVDADRHGRSAPAPAHKTIVNQTRHSIYESEADMVAPDTVMRYGRRPSVAP
jgi:hypothetical protein